MLSIMIRKLSFFIRFYNSCKKFFDWQCIFALFLLFPLIHCASNYKKEYAPSAGDNKSIPQGMNADKKATENGKEKKNEVGETLYLSADDSNSTASASITRQQILNKKYVQPDIVRTYEFLNYYDFQYKTPSEKEFLRIGVDLKKEESGKFHLQVGLRSKDQSLKSMSPLNLTFLLDNSGSMNGNSLSLAKETIVEICKHLTDRDRISLITVNRQSNIILNNQKAKLKAVQDALSGIEANDITDLTEGIKKAYEIAGQNYDANSLNRVIVLSDGATNAGKESLELISKYSQDSDKQGIYLVGIGFGQGFNDNLMNHFTDKGRGGYLFIDSSSEIKRFSNPVYFVSVFDIALKDVRLKMELPVGWKVEKFHGEQISTKAEEVTPQYLSYNDQMIYSMKLSTTNEKNQNDKFSFEAEYTPIGKKSQKLKVNTVVNQMLSDSVNLLKGEAITEYAEMLKEIKYPLDTNKEQNLKRWNIAFEKVSANQKKIKDKDLTEILDLLNTYKNTIEWGESFSDVRDKTNDSVDAVLGISPNEVLEVKIESQNPKTAIRALSRLNQSIKLVPMEGYKFLALSSGAVGSYQTTTNVSNFNSTGGYAHPSPEFNGTKKNNPRSEKVFDLSKIQIRLRAPQDAKSFSFDFNFFSAEYPGFVKKNFNDTFFAIIEAASTNDGKPTNISFDPNNNSIEVDNNYFENEFHPIPNTGTGFDSHGSTGWLRSSWPIKPGEEFTLTFTIHDEGDGIYDSMVLLDNFRWSPNKAVGTTDPLN